jgi:uncharacterized protein
MSRNFLAAVYQGKNFWWMYLSIILALAIYWIFLGRLTVDFYLFLFDSLGGDPAINSFVADHLPFAGELFLLVLAVTKIHRRRFLSLVNPEASIQVKRLCLGLTVWGLQNLIFSGLDLLTHPKDYQLTFNPHHWFLFLLFGILLIPIQTSAEEFIYRGYLMQGLSLINRHPFVLIAISSVAFTIPHLGNPEMARGFEWGVLTYFAWGVFFSLITLKDQGLELSLGVHAANNLFLSLVVNTPDSVVPTQAIYSYIGTINARDGFFSLLIQIGIFYAIFFGGIPRSSKLTPPQQIKDPS